ncbi:MAG TPA: protein kinase [Solirubrobacteraceae bacterium]|nr:protein kinase [Solirubrobacteraceae bacterium]
MARATASITLPDRYRVIRHIANGGMASVWEAHDEVLNRAVAVKVLAAHLSEDDSARQRFEREARTAAGLSSHPHVATIYDVGEHEGKAYIVMELLPGGSLADRLKSGREIDDDTALRWLAESGSALDAAHEAGIVHRDVKPANMLLDAKDRLALGDFGIARVALESQITQTGQVLGTAAYISPEQAMGEPATPASDRYALAVVAFELLTGAKPFSAENFAAQARAHVEDPPPTASALDRSLPKAVDRVLERGMAKDPADRWPSAAAFVTALDDALDAEPDEPTRVLPPTARAAPRAEAAALPPLRREPARSGTTASGAPKRSWGTAALLALALLIVAIAGAAVLIAGGGDDEDPGRTAGESTPAPEKTAKPEKTKEPEETATATPEATSTPEPTPEPTATAEPTEEPENGNGGGNGNGLGNDPEQLQLRAYELNEAGDPAGALRFAERAVQRCEGSTAISPCAYALFEYARAQLGTGNPEGAIQALEERKARFPGDQPEAVEQLLQEARDARG